MEGLRYKHAVYLGNKGAEDKHTHCLHNVHCCIIQGLVLIYPAGFSAALHEQLHIFISIRHGFYWARVLMSWCLTLCLIHCVTNDNQGSHFQLSVFHFYCFWRLYIQLLIPVLLVSCIQSCKRADAELFQVFNSRFVSVFCFFYLFLSVAFG